MPELKGSHRSAGRNGIVGGSGSGTAEDEAKFVETFDEVGFRDWFSQDGREKSAFLGDGSMLFVRSRRDDCKVSLCSIAKMARTRCILVVVVCRADHPRNLLTIDDRHVNVANDDIEA